MLNIFRNAKVYYGISIFPSNNGFPLDIIPKIHLSNSFVFHTFENLNKKKVASYFNQTV